MPLSFNPFLVNSPGGDPGLFISFSFDRRAIMFDLGDIYTLSPRDILKISHIFVTHTHMDHFSGFDRLLRITLGREKKLYLYGPEGFINNIQGKLAGYSWNLVKNFNNQFILNITEIRKNNYITQELACQDGFIPVNEPKIIPKSKAEIHSELTLNVKAEILDHDISCLGFSLVEKFRVNIKKNKLKELKLTSGPWLYQFKLAVLNNADPETIIKVQHEKNNITKLNNYKLGELKNKLTIITKGQKIGYVADVAYNESNKEKIIQLVKGADQLFIEAAFLDSDIKHASKKGHLTARQAGEIAGLAGVKKFTLFHFSPRYQEPEEAFYREATAAYQKTVN
jgi:ribonuclease Z